MVTGPPTCKQFNHIHNVTDTIIDILWSNFKPWNYIISN